MKLDNFLLFRFFACISIAFFCGSVLADSSGGERDSYRLDSGDKISISVFGEDDLSLITVISDTGTVSYPFLGELKVKGLTLVELENNVISGLKDGYLIDPKVTVSAIAYRPFFIHGEVKNSGGYPYQPGLTLRKAVTLAGGFSERAARNKIMVIRESDPNKNPVKIDMNDVVQPGDTIMVEESFF